MGVTYDDISEEDWLKELNSQAEWNKRHLLSMFSLLGIPESLLDVGCGDGTMVKLASQIGVRSTGVDQLQPTKDGNFFYQNLVDKFSNKEKVNMVLCLEVAEHIHESAHATLCDTCTDNLIEGRGNFLVFSAAYPNQGGIGHVAERPAKYWMDQFSLRGLNYRKDLTTKLSLLWSNIESPLYWLAGNVLIFEK